MVVQVAMEHLVRDAGNTGMHFFSAGMREKLFTKLKRNQHPQMRLYKR